MEDYRRVGKRNPKWDAIAEETLRLFAERNAVRFDDPDEDPLAEGVGNAARRAMEAGCDDPLVRYCYVSFHPDTRQMRLPGINSDACRVALELEASGYAMIRKFWGYHRAALSIRDGIFSPEAKAARPLEAEAPLVPEIIRDLSVPLSEAASVLENYLTIIAKTDGDPLEKWKELEHVWTRYRSNSIEHLVLSGDLYISHAWKARGNGFASEVTEEGWRLFKERLDIAGLAFRRAYEIDPSDPRAATGMLQVVAHTDPDEMGVWFDRALSANSNNLEACTIMLNYMQPKWGGSVDKMLTFGRGCVTSDKYGERVVRTLIVAHEMLREPGAGFIDYARKPGVWEDIQLAYNELIRRNPAKLKYYEDFGNWAVWSGRYTEARTLSAKRLEISQRQKGAGAADPTTQTKR